MVFKGCSWFTFEMMSCWTFHTLHICAARLASVASCSIAATRAGRRTPTTCSSKGGKRMALMREAMARNKLHSDCLCSCPCPSPCPCPFLSCFLPSLCPATELQCTLPLLVLARNPKHKVLKSMTRRGKVCIIALVCVFDVFVCHASSNTHICNGPGRAGD